MAVHAARRGITLMEVLISIGILAIGLTSVVSLVPAGQSQAARAVILDRAAAAVANGLHDAVTYGFTKPDAVNFDATPGAVWVFDPVVHRNPPVGGTGQVYPGAVGAWLKLTGVYSQGAPTISAPPATVWPITQLVGQGRDDIVLKAGPGADDAPLNVVDANGVRMFNGRMTCLFAVARADNQSTAAPEAGDVAKLTVVAFHNRDQSDPTTGFVDATYDSASASLTITGPIPTGRTLKEIIRPGAVIYDSKKVLATDQYQRWSQLMMASIDPAEGINRAFVTFTSPPPSDGAVRILLDSVGMAEQMVVLEGPGPYSK